MKGDGQRHRAGLDEVPLGSQPEENGKLQCLICRRWFGQLGQHVVAKHAISADDYRQQFGLPASRGLHSARILEARSQRGRERWRDDPTFRAKLRPARTTAAEREARSRQARSASADRPGVQAALAANAAAGHSAWLATLDGAFTAAARAAGFDDLPHLLDATIALPAHEVATLLGTHDVRQVWRVRRRYGHRSTGGGRPPGVGAGESRQCLECHRWYRGLGQHITMAHKLSIAEYRLRHPMTAADLAQTAGARVKAAGRGSLTAAQLAEIPPGVQPDDGAGRLLCLRCGQWYRGLSQHITQTHRLSASQYRRQYKLATNCVLSMASRAVAAAVHPPEDTST